MSERAYAIQAAQSIFASLALPCELRCRFIDFGAREPVEKITTTRLQIIAWC